MERYGSIPKEEPQDNKAGLEPDDVDGGQSQLAEKVRRESQSLSAEEVLRKLAENEGVSIEEALEKYG